MIERLKRIALSMSSWPIIGRYIRVIGKEILNYQSIVRQVPALLQTVSEINHRQLSSDTDKENLVKSVPIALRKITRDISDINRQLSDTKEQLSDTKEQLSDTKEQLSDTKEQLVNLTESVSYLLGRVEFVRRELMFEMRYGASKVLDDSKQLKVKAEILSPEKLIAFKSDRLRLNLGCGNIPLAGYLNVDRRSLPGVDIVAEVDELPFELEEVDKIFSAHLLEHFPKEQLRRELLPYFFNLLKEGGEFHAVVPDAEAMIREYSSGHYSYDDMREVLYGAQDYDGDFHFNMFTPLELNDLLVEAGFINVTVLDQGRKNGKCYEFEVLAKKPNQNSAVN